MNLRKLSVLALALGLIGFASYRYAVYAQSNVSGGNSVTISGALPSGANQIGTVSGDLCATAAKSSASVSITTATTTSIVGVSGSTTVYVCGFLIDSFSTTTANTVQFEYGTGAACTAPVVLTGAMTNGTALSVLGYGNGSGTIFKSAASNGLCIVSTVGSTPTITGVVTYVQQ